MRTLDIRGGVGRWQVLRVLMTFLACGLGWQVEAASFAVEEAPGHLKISCDGKPVADYVFKDPKIYRPYFSQLMSPAGIQLTRNHPPKPGDPADHAGMHPGLWLAFGDINGEDFWRNRAVVRHERFVESPRVEGGKVRFVVSNRYEGKGRVQICRETCRYTLERGRTGYLLTWDSEFEAVEGDVVFGDQEEMGLGVRVNTAITVKNGGHILNSAGGKEEEGTWGKPFDWIDYSGVVDGVRVGVTLMPHPENLRKSWAHSRDYGVVVANPFGRQAMKQGEKSEVRVKKGEKLRLRFGVLLHSGEAGGAVDVSELGTVWEK